MNSPIPPPVRTTFFATLIASTLLASSAFAEISILLNVDRVTDESDSYVSTATGSWLLVADTTGDGFGSLQPGSIGVGELVGSSDLIIARGDFATFATPGVISAAPTALSFANGWNEGDPIALVWFPVGGASRSAVADGDAYGLYHSAAGESTSAPWLTPSDGTFDHGLQLLTTDGLGFFGAGATDPANATASLQVGAAAQDSDGDGIPDDWEIANGLNHQDPGDAPLDPDGDCRSNLAEYLAGTDPNDPLSRLVITSIIDTDGDQSVFALSWTSVTNAEVTYEVSSSVDMTAWTVELSNIPAVGPSTTRDVTITTGDAIFFRVRAMR